MSNRWMWRYYWPHIRRVQREIESKSDNYILRMNTKRVVESYLKEIRLPLIEKRGNRRFKSEKIKVRTVLRNDDYNEPLELEKRTDIRIVYPIKHQDRIEELFKDRPFDYIEFLGGVDYTKGTMVFWTGDDDSYDWVNRIVEDVEEVVERINRDIKSGNEFARAELTQFIEDFKIVLQRERMKAKRKPKSRRNADDEGDGDWDNDDDQGRTPNDDRSDTLNPNNPAYDDARDNRADQLNPNNPRYGGRR